MANNITGFLERLTAAAGDYNKAKVGELSALDAVYLDVRPEVARQGQAIRVYFPDAPAFTDQAANDWSPNDVDPNYVDVMFGQRPGNAVLIRDFEQFQTSTDIIDQFIDPNYKRAMEFANQQVFNLATASNFNAYAPINSAASAALGVADVKLAWNLLVRNKVPIRDQGNASLLYHVDLHANTLTDTTWYQENLVGAVIAQSTREQAAPAGQNWAFRFNRRYDQQAPTGQTANLSGTVALTNGSAAVTGTSTTFTKQATAGSWITFGSDTASYPVASVASDTSLTLQQAYGGSTASGVSFKRTTYTSVAMHKYAIALAVRPLEIVNDGHIHTRLVKLKGLPIRVMLSYSHQHAGWMLTMDYGMVAVVMRPDFGVIINS